MLGSSGKHGESCRHALFRWLTCVLFFTGFTQLGAEPLVLKTGTRMAPLYEHMAVFVDPTGKLSASDVAALDPDRFQRKFARPPRFDPGTDSLWIRLRLTNQSTRRHWILDLNRARLDRVAAYVMTPEGPLRFARSGWKTPRDEIAYPHRDNVIPITIAENQTAEYLLRVHHPQTRLVLTFQLYEDRVFIETDRLESSIFGVYFGILLTMAITNGFFFLALRDRAFLLYTLFLISFGVLMLHSRGLDRQFFGALEGWNLHTAYYLHCHFTTVLGILFISEFFRSDRKDYGDYLLQGMLILATLHFVFALGMSLAGFTNYANYSLLWILLPAPLAIFALIFSRLTRRETSALYILTGTGLFVLGVFIQIFQSRGILTYNPVTANAALIGSGFDMILISLGLGDRFRRLQSQSETHRLASETKSRFLAHMSHEIRTPLNAVLGMSELLYESPLSDEQKKYLGVLRRSGRSLLSTINDILDLSKIESGHMALESIRFRPTSILENLRDEHSGAAAARGIALKLEIDPRLPEPVSGDPTRLRQVLSNLLSNAIKFTETGSVTLHARPMDRYDGFVWIQFEVVDTGIGIPREQRERIFESFTQADDSTTRKYGGTGLGLAISREAVGLMGGEIGVDSTPGRGSRFHVDIPFNPAERLEPETNPARPMATAQPRVPGLTILLAEDNEDNRLLFQAFLKSTPHRIDIARDGAEAVDHFRASDYDIIFMDIQMPVLSGLEAVRRIRGLESERRTERRTPIYALTAHAFEHERDASHAAGCDGHITKPLEKATLLKLLEAVTPRA